MNQILDKIITYMYMKNNGEVYRLQWHRKDTTPSGFWNVYPFSFVNVIFCNK